VLGHRSDALEIRVTIDWREQAHLMKLCFPAAVDDPRGTFEIPFGSLEKPVDGGERPAQSWVDLSGTVAGRPAGLAVVNNAKHAYDVSPGADGESPSIGITAVRSPVYSWHDPRLLDPAGFYSFQDQGVQSFRVLLVPHVGDWRAARLHRRAAELGQAPRAMLESFHPGALPASGSFAADGDGAVMITAVKGWEEPGADVIVRAVETLGAEATARLELPVAGRVIEAEFGPSQIRTFRVPVEGGPVAEVDLLERDLDEAGPFHAADMPTAGAGADLTPDPASSDAISPAEQAAPGQSRLRGD